ncbi:MAG: Na+/H+ antiporter subunit E [Saezia sp.]
MKKWVKKIFPAPIITCMLALGWLMLNRSLSHGHLLLALLLGIAIPVFLAPLRPTPVKIRKPLVIAKLFGRVFIDVIEANFFVAKGILQFGKNKPQGDFVYVPLELKDPNGLATLALICTVVPATIWSELALDRSAVYLHVFGLVDPEEESRKFKSRYEKPLMEIYES